MQIPSDKEKKNFLDKWFYKAYVSHNQDFEHDHAVDIKFREKNNLITLVRLRSGACSMFAMNSAIFLIKSNFVLPKTFMEQWLKSFIDWTFNIEWKHFEML